ncbi:hypothetical protein V5799_017734 [Amblyomma americanum]|uniref:receptor protein-tyrosine kinase n=1 Tax=Amblyomma americanum TaxID=6943 RepID=A0AAQ4F2D5_AMBAM
MDAVETAFHQTVENCNKGTSKARLSLFFHDKSDLKCKETSWRANICTPSVNSYIEGLEPLTGTATMEFRQGLATSVTVMEQNGVTVAWVGDSEGYLHKVVRVGDSSKLLYWTDVSNGEGTLIEKSTALDSKGEFGYFLTGDKVLKFPVGSCSIYRTCSKCLRSHEDPLRCGWCDGRCAHSGECPKGTNLFFDQCPIEVYNNPDHVHGREDVIQRVNPKSGPTSGGTMLTIAGDNFGYWWRESTSSIKITLGGRVCEIINWVSSLVKCKTPPAEGAAKVDITISVNDTNRDAKKNYDVIHTLTLPSAFEYKVATLSGVVPDYGPVAGGTNVTLLGVNLDIGSQRAVMIGGTTCKIYKFNQTTVQCSTSAAPADQEDSELRVALAIDGVTIPFISESGLGFTFRFMPNPFIGSIAPMTAFYSEQPAIAADGVHLHSVSKPAMVTRVASLDNQKQESITTACRALEDGRKLLCPGPSLTQFSVISSAELQKHRLRIQAQVSFQMDGLHLPPNSTGGEGHFTFTYRPPLSSYTPGNGSGTKVAQLTEVLPCYGPVAGGTNLTLRGTNLDTGSQRLVTIGESICSIKRVDSVFLHCTTSAVSMDQAHMKMPISLNISGVEVPFVSKGNFCSHFTYKPNPEVYDIAPKAATPSGPSVIEAQGKYLDSVATPVMVTLTTSLNNEHQGYTTGACRVTEGGRKMHCPRASLMESSFISSTEMEEQQLPIVVQISFRMDGLHLPKNGAGEKTYFNFTYLPEQRIVAFSETAEGKEVGVTAVHTTSIIAASSITVITTLVLSLWVVYRRGHTRNSKRTSGDERIVLMTMERAAHGEQSTTCAQSSQVTDVQPLIPSLCQLDERIKATLEEKQLLIDRKAVVLGSVIGHGNFGCVHEGYLHVGPGRDVKVAVKTLLHSYTASEADRETFLKEALIMKDFDHPNVLQLIGLTVDKKAGLMVITPYMRHGDLHTYLRDERKDLKLPDLLIFSVHVAKGMKYLTEKKLVHRDLAARNCMLSEDLVVRVADFGLSRAMYEKEYYTDRNPKTQLPIKWLAPESLAKSIYNHKTDVWAYGVLLWELMTKGAPPYPQVDNWDILRYLDQGLRMPKPEICPNELYEVMRQCWHHDPAQRPTFAELVDDITFLTTCLKRKKRNTIVRLDAASAANSRREAASTAELP